MVQETRGEEGVELEVVQETTREEGVEMEGVVSMESSNGK